METSPMTPPAPATPPMQPAAQPPMPSPGPTLNEGGPIDNITKGKMNYKDIVISVGLIVLTVWGIVYYRRGLKKLDEQPDADEFDMLSERVKTIETNLKRAMGKKYVTS